jgi:putative transposase
MRDLILLLIHVLATSIRLARPAGVRSVLAESVLLKHQLLILNRSRHRAPNLRALDRLIAGFCSLWIKPNRILRSAIALKPSTLLNFHRALVQRKYRLLFSPKHRAKPGPKGPDQDLIGAVVDMKKRNPRWGCPRIAKQIELAFGIPIKRVRARRPCFMKGTRYGRKNPGKIVGASGSYGRSLIGVEIPGIKLGSGPPHFKEINRARPKTIQ